MNPAILNKDVQAFIDQNLNTDIAVIGLRKSPFASVSSKELAEQIDSKRRAQHKLPLWFGTAGIYYPGKIAMEQCSSERAAAYKAGLLRGETVIDLTGGFGVDAGLFSMTAKQVTHCETNGELSAISEHNSRVLDFDIRYHHGNGISFIETTAETFDTVYVDPSRRTQAGKVFFLRDCEPDVVSRQDVLLKKARRLIVKTAPLLDLQSTIRELAALSEIHVISIKNECKEVLYVADNDFSGTEPLITCASLHEDGEDLFSFQMSQERNFTITGYSEPLRYLYEPDVALLKAGCFKLITQEFGVKKLDQHTHLYTSDRLEPAFIGRKFRVISTWDYGAFTKQKLFKKANIICRNFPQDTAAVRKKLKISEGGDDYLIFCTAQNRLLAVHCERVSMIGLNMIKR